MKKSRFSRRPSAFLAVISIITSLVISASAFSAGSSGTRGYFETLRAFTGLETEAPQLQPRLLSALGTCDTAGPIEIESSGGTTTPTAYATLTAAFAAINAGTHTGTIDIEVCGNTDEGTGTAVLNASGSGSASYSAINIKPVGGAARTISGATTAGNPTINFNGADNVLIDGLNTGGNSLTIENTTASPTSNTSTITFIGDAQSNTITNSTILGAANMAVATNGGTIFFRTRLATTGTGNDNNIISNNNIGPSGANLPTKAISSAGSTSAVAEYNSNITVSGNNIFDFFSSTVASAGIYLSSGTTDWTITNNRLFQTATRTQTAISIHAGIQTASLNVSGCTISGNTIGYASSTGTGTYAFVGNGTGSRFYPIYLSTHGTAAATNIQGNVIAAISVSGPLSGTNTAAPFGAIMVPSGIANIGTTTGNTIGSSSAGGSVSFNSSSVSASEVYGIFYAPTQNANISNNSIGGVDATNSSTGAVDLFGIRANTSTASVNTINNNTVGYAAAPMVNNASSTSSHTTGLRSQVGAAILTGNTISNMNMAAGSGTVGLAAPMLGIVVTNTSAGADSDISGNVIRNLSIADTVNNDVLAGIAYDGRAAGLSTVRRNLIYGLSVGDAAATNGDVSGIYIINGTATYENNMIALGNGVTAGNGFSGFNDTAASAVNNTYYHNSVYIGGSGAVGTRNTFAVNSTITLSNRDYRDNVFFNARSNGAGTGKHYAVRMGGTGTNPTGLTINNNVYLANGTGGVFGLYNGVDRADLAAWRAAIGQDAASFSGNPLFVNPSAATPDLHIQAASGSIVEANGFDVGVLTDFDGQTRATLTPVDIGADAGNFAAVAQPGQLNFNPASYTPAESVGTLTLTVTRTGGDDGVVTVDYDTPLGALTGSRKQEGAIPTANGGSSCSTPGVDYITASGTLTFADGDTSESFGVTICDDSVFEGNENFGVQLSNAMGGATIGAANQASVIIQDNDAAPTISINDVSIAEGESGFAILTFTVSKSGATELAASVNFQSSDITATSSVGQTCGTPLIDYEGVSGGLTFQPNETTQPINVAICGDVAAEANETFRITLSGASNATISDNEGIGTITDNEAATLVVDNLTDNIGLNACTAAANDCSLRGANSVAVDGDIITFDPGIFSLNGVGQTIAVGSELLIANDITINGPGADNLTIDGGAPDDNRVFTVNNATVTISGMTITNGGGVGSIGSGGGGAVYAAGGALTLDAVHILDSTAGTCGGGVQFDAGTHIIQFSTISGNLSSSIGGGVCNSGVSSLTIHNSTISGNTSTSSGGGMANNILASLRLSNSTVTLNNSSSNGGGVVQTGVSLILEGSIIAGNIDTLGNPEISNNGGAVTNGYNIVGDSANDAQNTGVVIVYNTSNDILNTPPQLGSLTDNGGPTLTHRPNENGPGHDKGKNFGVPPFTTDQRGNARTVDWGITNAPGGDGTDIGSVELLVPTAAAATISGRVRTSAGRGIAKVYVFVEDENGAVLTSALTNSFGYFTLHGLPVGETYIVSVKGRRYRFGNPSQVVSLQDNIVGMEFIADP